MMTKYKEMYALMGVRLFRHDLMAAAARNEETREFDPTSEYMQIFDMCILLRENNCEIYFKQIVLSSFLKLI